jgi:hypothetical protein
MSEGVSTTPTVKPLSVKAGMVLSRKLLPIMISPLEMLNWLYPSPHGNISRAVCEDVSG